MLLGFAEYRRPARALATALGMDYAEVQVHRFPDGESKVILPVRLPPHVIVCRSLDRPNDKLIELLLTAKTARHLGAQRLTLVAPYLCYMRQDMAFTPGEAVSQQIIGELLASLFDAVLTVDPHLHRIDSMSAAVPARHSIALSAGPLMSEFLQSRGKPVLIGPDSESLQWVQGIAQAGGLPYGIAAKTRHGDRAVSVALPDIDLHGRAVVLIDDVLSSGETVAIAAEQCRAAGAARVDVLVTHALFANGASERLVQAGISHVWSTDSIPHDSNALHLAGLLARALREIS